MFVAREFDAEAEGRPYISPRRRRLVAPDLRSRLYGYLAHAPEVELGWRSDGVWVWPESLATHVLSGAAVPQRQFADHIGQQWILLPDRLDEATLAQARA